MQWASGVQHGGIDWHMSEARRLRGRIIVKGANPAKKAPVGPGHQGLGKIMTLEAYSNSAPPPVSMGQH
jgi:hypothetical protein